jgi:hypothetical protein
MQPLREIGRQHVADGVDLVSLKVKLLIGGPELLVIGALGPPHRHAALECRCCRVPASCAPGLHRSGRTWWNSSVFT